MIMGATCPGAEQVLQLVAAARGAGWVLVILPARCDILSVEKLLAMDEVAAVFGDQEVVDALRGNGRVFALPPTEAWTFPVPGVNGLLLPEPLSVVSWQWLLGAWKSGVEHLLTPERDGKWHLSSARLALLSQLAVRAGRKMLQKLALGDTWHGHYCQTRLRRSALGNVKVAPGSCHPGKIMLVIGSLAPGGAERQFVVLANGLAEAGADVSVLVQRLSAPADRFFLPALNSTIRAFELPSLLEVMQENVAQGRRPFSETFLDARVWSLVFHPRYVDEVRRYRHTFEQERPEVVHVWLDSTAVAVGLAAILAGVPRIVLGMRSLAPVHFDFFLPYFHALYRVLLSCPQVSMINNSQAGATDYSQWLGVDAARIGVVYNGVSEEIDIPATADIADWQRSIGLARGVPVVGGVFRFGPEKDPLCWLDVARQILDKWSDKLPPPQFLLLGDGPLWAEMVAYSARLGLADQVLFVKREARVALAIASMDVLLLTSRVEGTPNVLIEAQSLGCPVVTTDAGGCPETLLEGKTGWVVKVGDREALSERVVAVLQDTAWRTAARCLAPDFVAGRFGTGRLVSDMRRVYGVR